MAGCRIKGAGGEWMRLGAGFSIPNAWPEQAKKIARKIGAAELFERWEAALGAIEALQENPLSERVRNQGWWEEKNGGFSMPAGRAIWLMDRNEWRREGKDIADWDKLEGKGLLQRISAWETCHLANDKEKPRRREEGSAEGEKQKSDRRGVCLGLARYGMNDDEKIRKGAQRHFYLRFAPCQKAKHEGLAEAILGKDLIDSQEQVKALLELRGVWRELGVKFKALGFEAPEFPAEREANLCEGASWAQVESALSEKESACAYVRARESAEDGLTFVSPNGSWFHDIAKAKMFPTEKEAAGWRCGGDSAVVKVSLRVESFKPGAGSKSYPALEAILAQKEGREITSAIDSRPQGPEAKGPSVLGKRRGL